MNILFIRPMSSPQTIGLQHVMIVEPLELEVLGAIIRPHDKAVVVDMILEKNSFLYFLKKENPDMVCITGYITHVSIIIDYCKQVKNYNQKILTVVGGVHCEVCPNDFKHHAIDFRIVRNATRAFPALLEHCDNKHNRPEGILCAEDDLVKETLPAFDFFFPVPDRNLTEKYRSQYFYIFHDKIALLKTSFGCPGLCNFCFCREITDRNYVQRPLNEVIQELSQIKENDIYIVDDDFLADKKRLLAFLDILEKENIKKKYLIYGRADFIAANPDIIVRFKKNGLKTVITGIESFSDNELQKYNKNINSEINKKALKTLRALDIDCYATVIVSPDWDRNDFNKCGTILRKLGIHYVNLQPLTPLPGTQMIANDDTLLISRNDFASWDLAHVTIKPTRLSVSEYYRQIVKLYSRILFQPHILFRYFLKYSPVMLYKMLIGSIRVRQQYIKKIREAQHA